MINDNNTTLGMFTPKFDEERKFAYAVDVGLYLWSELIDGEGDFTTCVVVAVIDDVDNDVDKFVACVAIV